MFVKPCKTLTCSAYNIQTGLWYVPETRGKCMVKGDLIGKGMTAEVYEWGRDKVLKLYFDRFGDEWVDYEAGIGNAVHKAGVPSPAVYDIVNVDGRKGIIFQRIFGKSILKRIQAEPWDLYKYATGFAGLQYKIHQCRAESLPTQKERFTTKIKSSSQILGELEGRILDYIDSLPNGNSVCHGDFHFNNIIISDNDMIPIDWNNAYKGDPMSDIARTCLMMISPSKPHGTADFIIMLSQYVKWSTYWTYLNEYMRLSKTSFNAIDAWVLPAAAAKLRDKVPGEEKWLLDIIHNRLT